MRKKKNVASKKGEICRSFNKKKELLDLKWLQNERKNIQINEK